MLTIPSIWLVGILIAGISAGYILRRWIALNQKTSIERRAKETSEAAKAEAKKIILAAEEKVATIFTNSQEEERKRKEDVRRREERLLAKEDNLEKQKNEIEAESKKQKDEALRIKRLEEEVKNLETKAIKELERITGLSKETAKDLLFKETKETYREELGKLIIGLEKEKRDQIEERSKEIILTAIQRYTRSTIADATTSIVHLPNEDIKGKIIGREGRNIKTFERITGVEVIIDETPESIILSSFDPIRREIARIALEKLIRDGRIQPAKIEEKVEEAKQQLETEIKKTGEEAVYEVGIIGFPKEIISLIGRLNYRTSYGQNVLLHSIEMAHIAGMIAAELNLDVETTKKAALLHDIGKAINYEVEGAHVEIGRKLLKKYNIDEKIIQAMEAHHDEYPFAIPEAYVIAAADAISAARPGARRDTLEKYLKRLEEIEKVAKSFPNVLQAYAISAGREVRVFVMPEKIDDFGALTLAKEIANKLQRDVQYPGEIKITVIREIKAIEYAR